MPQPTLSDYQESNWGDNSSASEVTPTVTWSAGDYILVVGAVADNSNTLNTPTATGLTFSAVAGTPSNVSSRCKFYAWEATAGSSGSSAVTATVDGASTARGISVFVFSGSDGIGNVSIDASQGSTTTQSLTRSGDNSHVVQVQADWDAVNDTTVAWTPSGETQREAVFVSGQWTAFVASWGDQGAAGTTSYGFTGGSGTTMGVLTIEVLGTEEPNPDPYPIAWIRA